MAHVLEIDARSSFERPAAHGGGLLGGHLLGELVETPVAPSEIDQLGMLFRLSRGSRSGRAAVAA